MKKFIFTILAVGLVLGGCWLSGDREQVSEDGGSQEEEKSQDDKVEWDIVDVDVEIEEGEEQPVVTDEQEGEVVDLESIT